jgi:hypothetical protein
LLPGENYLQQLNLILNLIGSPSNEDIEEIHSVRAKEYLRSMKKIAKKKFSDVFPGANPIMLDLLENLLVFNPVE